MPEGQSVGTRAGQPNPTAIDAYAPAEIAQRVAGAGVKKAAAPLTQTLVLAVLAGVFIAFGGAFFTLVMTGSPLGFGPARLLGGLAFCLGLILVVVGGAELFTGNNLIVMAWAERKVTTARLLRNWGLVYLGNLIGAFAMVALVWLSGSLALGEVAATAAAIAEGKTALAPLEAFVRGILCNALVCLAVWLCFAAHSVPGKIFALLWPITAFVALGFEHSVANMYLIPIGQLAGDGLDLSAFLGNLLPVTFGNILGGGLGVAGVYWAVYLRHA